MSGKIKMNLRSPNINMNNVAVDNNIEKILNSYGYVIMHKILRFEVFIPNKNEECMAEMIKAYDINGNFVYIALDTDGVCIPDGKDIKTNINNKTLDISHELKKTIFDAIKGITCGVVFECSTGICTYIRSNQDVKPVENSLSFKEDPGNEEDNNFFTYPIVKMSEILIGNDSIVDNTKLLTKRIQKVIVDFNDKIIKNLNEQNGLLTYNIDKFSDSQDAILRDLELMYDKIKQFKIRNSKKLNYEDLREETMLLNITVEKSTKYINKLIHIADQLYDINHDLKDIIDDIYQV